MSCCEFGVPWGLPIAIRCVSAWTGGYTSITARGVRRSRRLELRSHHHEQIAADRADGYTPSEVGARLLLQTALGVPSDLDWALHHIFLGSRVRRSKQFGTLVDLARSLTMTVFYVCAIGGVKTSGLGGIRTHVALRIALHIALPLVDLQRELLLERTRAVLAGARRSQRWYQRVLQRADLPFELRNTFTDQSTRLKEGIEEARTIIRDCHGRSPGELALRQ